MILSGETIQNRGIIHPWNYRTTFVGQYGALTFGVGPAGYDVQVEFEGGVDVKRLVPNAFILASTVERFQMPNDVLGVVHDKSTWVRRGLAVHNTVIEPGWRGHLTLEIKNVGDDILYLERLSPIAQIVFHVVDKSTSGYSGKYQDQQRGPQKAI